MDSNPCLVCDQENWQIISERDRKGAQLTTVLCRGCGLVSHACVPETDEIEEFYSDHYRKQYKHFDVPRLKHIYRAARGARRILKRLRPLIPAGGRGLDFGSGPGVKAYYFTINGYRMSALEPGTDYAAYSVTTFDLDVTASIWERARFDEPFDFILCHHVLEHLTNPFTALSQMNHWLDADGVLFLAVPDLEESFYNKDPGHFFHSAHIYNFNRETLLAICHKAGFEAIPENTHSGRNTSFVLRKVTEPDTNRFTSLPENAHLLQHKFESLDARKYYASTKPTIKFWNKTRLYFREWLTCLLQHDAKSIVRHFSELKEY